MSLHAVLKNIGTNDLPQNFFRIAVIISAEYFILHNYVIIPFNTEVIQAGFLVVADSI